MAELRDTKNQTWHHENIVPFRRLCATPRTIPSVRGTRMAITSPTSNEHKDLGTGVRLLRAGQWEPITEAIQEAARQSYTWFTNPSWYEALEPIQPAFNLVTQRPGPVTINLMVATRPRGPRRPLVLDALVGDAQGAGLAPAPPMSHASETGIFIPAT